MAFEPRAQPAQRAVEIAALNDVALEMRVEPCTGVLLAEVLGEQAGALVVCDCDGPEAEILDPSVTPALRRAELIVEPHDLLVPGVTERLEAMYE